MPALPEAANRAGGKAHEPFYKNTFFSYNADNGARVLAEKT